jgi:hypothetical protein
MDHQDQVRLKRDTNEHQDQAEVQVHQDYDWAWVITDHLVLSGLQVIW